MPLAALIWRLGNRRVLNMTEALYPVPPEWAERALVDAGRYADLYRQSVEEPEAFWRREAQRIDWIRPFTEISRATSSMPGAHSCFWRISRPLLVSFI